MPSHKSDGALFLAFHDPGAEILSAEGVGPPRIKFYNLSTSESSGGRSYFRSRVPRLLYWNNFARADFWNFRAVAIRKRIRDKKTNPGIKKNQGIWVHVHDGKIDKFW